VSGTKQDMLDTQTCTETELAALKPGVSLNTCAPLHNVVLYNKEPKVQSQLNEVLAVQQSNSHAVP